MGVTVVDMADPTSVTFSDGQKLQSTRGDIDVAALPDGTVYVSGGFTHENDYVKPHNTVERYDPKSRTWSPINSLSDERGDKQLVALNGKVYAIGGEAKVDITGVPEDGVPDLGSLSTVLDSVEVLDPSEDVHAGMAECVVWEVCRSPCSVLVLPSGKETPGLMMRASFLFLAGKLAMTQI